MGTVFCKHYKGMHDGIAPREKCEAGVTFLSLNPDPKPDEAKLDIAKIPCVLSDRHKDVEKYPCPCASYPTAEELAADKKENDERFSRMKVIRAAITEACGGPWKKGDETQTGTMDCPGCKKGKVHWSRAGYNGHVRAHCSTEGCASWME